MTSENMKLWSLLGRTDPKHTKSFTRGGGFKGTAIKPMWSYRRMTEEFGPCGIGWGVGAPEFQVVPAGDEVLVFCTASVWYCHGDELARTVYGVGGDKVVNKFSSGIKTDDEAFKKAFTDAVTNALKLIGVGADVHMGMFDDSKYVNTMKVEFAEPGSNVGTGERQATSEPPAKRQVGWSKDGTTRTANSLRKEGWWEQFESDLKACDSIPDLTKVALHWSGHAEKEKWPHEWKSLAKDEINAYREAMLQVERIGA